MPSAVLIMQFSYAKRAFFLVAMRTQNLRHGRKPSTHATRDISARRANITAVDHLIGMRRRPASHCSFSKPAGFCMPLTS